MRSRQLTIATVCRRCLRGRRVSSCVRRSRRSERAPSAAHDHGRTPAPERDGLGQLALERAARVVGVAPRRPRAAQLGEPARTSRRGARLARARRRRRCRRLGASTPASSSAISSRSMPGAEADAGRRRPADLLDEAVVAAAAGDGRVLVLHRPDELPGRARVVVEAADERRDELVARRPSRRGRRGPRRSGPRHASQSDSPIVGASRARRCTGWRLRDELSNTRSGLVAGLGAGLVVEPVVVRRRATRAGARGRPAGSRGSRSSSARAS